MPRPKKTKPKLSATPKRGVIYVRVSDEDQVQGTSLDDQERQCRDVFAGAGIELVRCFRDEGQSAKTAERAAFMDALQFCINKRNQIDVLLVWKVDRFARRVEDHWAIRKSLNDAGVQLRSVTEPIGDDPSSKLFEGILANFAEFDNAIRRVRCVNGMRARIRDGIWPFKAPVGYLNRSLARQDLKKTQPDPIDPVVFPILQRLLKGFARGVYTQSDMVRELELADFEKLTGQKPSLRLTDRLLGRQLPFYAGILRDVLGDEEELHAGRHEPMITEAEMRAIEAIRSRRKGYRASKVRRNSNFPLRGLVLCAACRRPLTGSSSRGAKAYYAYYHCYFRACEWRWKSIPKAELEEAVGALMKRLTLTPKFVALLAQTVVKEWEARRTTVDAAEVRRRLELEELAGKRAKIFELIEGGVYDAVQARERLGRIEQEIAEKNLGDLDPVQNDQSPRVTIEKAARLIEDVFSRWFSLEPELREPFQLIAFPERFTYDRKSGVGTGKLARIFELFQQFETSHSSSVDLTRVGWNEVLQELRSIAALERWVEVPRAGIDVPDVSKSPNAVQPRR